MDELFEGLFLSPEECVNLERLNREVLAPGTLANLRLKMREIAYAKAAREKQENKDVAIQE